MSAYYVTKKTPSGKTYKVQYHSKSDVKKGITAYQRKRAESTNKPPTIAIKGAKKGRTIKQTVTTKSGKTYTQTVEARTGKLISKTKTIPTTKKTSVTTKEATKIWTPEMAQPVSKDVSQYIRPVGIGEKGYYDIIRQQSIFTPTQPEAYKRAKLSYAVISEGKPTKEEIQEKPISTVSAYKPPSWFKQPLSRINIESEKFEQQREKYAGRNTLKAMMYSLPAFALGVAKYPVSLAYSVTHPKQTLTGLKHAAIHPMETGYEIGKYIKEQSATFTGEVVSAYGTGKLVKRGIKKQPVHIEKAEIRLPTKAGEKTLYKGIGIRYGSKGQPLVGVSGGRLKIGTPKIELGKVTKPFIVEKATETKILLKNIDKYANEIQTQQFKKGLSIMQKTEKVSSKFIQKQFPTEVKYLSPKQAKQVLKFAKKQKATVYGSAAAKTQIPKEIWQKYRGGKLPADIDVQLQLSTAKTQLKAQQLAQQLQKIKGYQIRISKEVPTLIEAKVGGEWHHAVDIHSMEQAFEELTSPAVAGEKAYGLSITQKPIKISGVTTQRLSEQGIRKGASMFTATPIDESIKFAPQPHRMKDIADFFATQETLAKSKLLGKTKLLGEIESLKGLYPEKLITPKIPTKIPIYSPPTKIPSPSIPIIIPPSPTIQASSIPKISVTPSLPKSPSIPKSPSLPKYPSIPKSPSLPKYPSIPKSPSLPKSPSIPKSPSLPKSPSISKLPTFRYSPSPLLPKTPKRKIRRKRRKKKISQKPQPKKYTPTYEELSLLKFGKMPKRLTGIELRPIPIKFKKQLNKLKKML